MPTYQYRCPHCGHDFEEFQSISDAPLDTCPRCGKKPRRLISGGAGFLFKGNGFYTTDYRSESYKAAAKKEESTSKPSDDKAGKSSDKKPKAEKAAN
jgi:putative FmdB family regulatory protein